MTKYEFGNPSGEEPVRQETKDSIYRSFENILGRDGIDEDEVFLTASTAVKDTLLTSGPEDSMPVIQIRKPYKGPAPTHNFDYEVIYGFGPKYPESALHIAFLGDNKPIVRGVKTGPLNPLSAGDSPMIETGWPTGALCENDAQRLLGDLQNIETSPGIGE